MLRRTECRLNFKNRPVRTGDIKGGGGPKQPPPPATNRGSQEPATNRVNLTGSNLYDSIRLDERNAMVPILFLYLD